MRDDDDDWDDDRPRRRRRRDDWDDRSRRRREAAVPGWLWALGGTFAVVLLLLGAYFATRRDRAANAPQAGADPQLPVPVAGSNSNAPGVPVPALGEVIPLGWDRVGVPGTKMTLLMPQGAYPGLIGGDEFLGEVRVVKRGLVTPADDTVRYSAAYFEAKGTAPPGLPDAPASVPQAPKDNRSVTVCGYPAVWAHYAAGDLLHTTVRIEPGGLKFYAVLVAGKGMHADHPDVKRCLDSISFTLPPKAGPRAPLDYDPPWTRRFAPGHSFSAEAPSTGRRPSLEGGLPNPARRWTWGSDGILNRRDKDPITFSVFGVARYQDAPNPPDPRKQVQESAEWLKSDTEGKKFVRWVEVDGRPGFVSASTPRLGPAKVEVRFHELRAEYYCQITGDGITPDSPEVKRCLASVSFTVPPPGK